MRKTVVACLIGLAAINGAFVTSQALAQQGQGQRQKQKQAASPTRPQPPVPRCPDLGVGTTAFISEVPGGPPLAQGEIAVTLQVRNDGNAMFAAARPDDTSVALEYTSPAGATRLAAVPAITIVDEEGHVRLTYGQSVRGLIRAVVPAEAAGRRLRLRLVYANEGSRRGIPDCNEANNTVTLQRPPAPAAAPAAETTPAPAPSGR
jgi:hypothetical protein